MNQTLIAKQQMFYRHRALTAGQAFEATPVDAGYFVRRGMAAPHEVAPVVVPVVAPVVAELVAEPFIESVVELPVVESEPALEPPAPVRRTYTRRTPPTE